MLKVLGSLLVLGAAGRVWLRRKGVRDQEARTLRLLLNTLEEMENAIRLERTSMPRLLSHAARGEGAAGAFFQSVGRSVGQGDDLAAAWRQSSAPLALPPEAKTALADLGGKLTGDETRACQGIQFARCCLEGSLEELRRQRPEQEKREAALWLSGAALLIILLI